MKYLRVHRAWSVLFVCLLSACFVSACFAREPVLPERYGKWLHEEVTYLITTEERQSFLALKTNEDRDRFIEQFWRARNPDANAPTNAVKDAYYQRLAYANAHFGQGNVQDGWRSDRGMVYITLGAPKQIDRYPETMELKPIQIWFYENLSGALPVHFYVLFYKQSPAEDYELYSPYGDRPQKLINSTNAINDDHTAIKLIQRDINDEAAHVALSLIPGEPVDLKNPTPTLQSDVLLNNIRNYRNLPQIRELIASGRSASETVTHRILVGEQLSDLTAVATRDAGKQASIHYLLRLVHPDDFSMAEQSDGRYYYSLQVKTTLTDANGKVAFDKTEPLTSYVSDKRLAEVQGRCFGVEGRLPAAPGTYQLSLTMTNLVTTHAFRQTRSVVVPTFGDELGISQVFFADSLPPQRSVSAEDPFSFSGVRLQPLGADHVAIVQGVPLRAIFQIWTMPGDPVKLSGKKIDIHYLIGRLTSPTHVEEDQQVDRSSFTPDGDLLMGKDLRTDTLAPGIYRLVVKVTNPETAATAYQSLNFEVLDSTHATHPLWTLSIAEAGK